MGFKYILLQWGKLDCVNNSIIYIFYHPKCENYNILLTSDRVIIFGRFVIPPINIGKFIPRGGLQREFHFAKLYRVGGQRMTV